MFPVLAASHFGPQRTDHLSSKIVFEKVATQVVGVVSHHAVETPRSSGGLE